MNQSHTSKFGYEKYENTILRNKSRRYYEVKSTIENKMITSLQLLKTEKSSTNVLQQTKISESTETVEIHNKN